MAATLIRRVGMPATRANPRRSIRRSRSQIGSAADGRLRGITASRKQKTRMGEGFLWPSVDRSGRLRMVRLCPGPDSNRHGPIRVRRILSPLRLPISPPGQETRE